MLKAQSGIKNIYLKKKFNKRVFLHFGAVNYLANIYLNGKILGIHEGGFTPFQYEITNEVLEAENTVIVKANNQRLKDGLPALGYDWFNYGGITRDVHLVETNQSYIEDYFIQLEKHSVKNVLGWVKFNGNRLSQSIRIQIPELKINYPTKSNIYGFAEVKFPATFQLWSPENPKLYRVVISSETDTIEDNIGFRSLQVSGTKILLNGKPLFLRG